MSFHKLLTRFFIATSTAIAVSRCADAEVTLPRIFASHMALRCSEPVHISGWAAPVEEIRVSFCGGTKAVATDSFGDWEVYL